jgi:cytochrome c oxidase subunit 3
MSAAHPAADALLLREDQTRLGLWTFLATVIMLFAAFASAYVVRRSGSDWRHVVLPSRLWMNTAILAGSSLAVELASLAGRRRRRHGAAAGMVLALMLGVAFLLGQWLAWRDLMAAGVYLPSSPHASFFYVLTGAHGVHVGAALIVLSWGLAVTRSAALDWRRWQAQTTICRTFWHFLGAVWLLLFGLVSL